MDNADKINSTAENINSETEKSALENAISIENAISNENAYSEDTISSESDLHGEVITLLKNELQSFSSVQEKINFDIEKEFVKAKANKGKFIWNNVIRHLLIGIVIVLAVTAGIVYFTNIHNNQTEVHVRDFDSINMKSLQDQVADIQGKREIAVNDKKRYLEEMKESYDSINKEFELNMQILDSVYYNIINSDSTENSETENIEENAESSGEQLTEKQLKAEKAEYEAKKSAYEKLRDTKKSQVKKLTDKKVAECDASIVLYDERLKQYDEVMESSDSNQELIDVENYRYRKIISDYEEKLAKETEKYNSQVEMDLQNQKELVNRVTSQYDPEVSQESKVYQEVLSKNLSYQKKYNSQQKVNSKASEEFTSALEKQKNYYADLFTVYEGYSKFPQKNTNAIPVYADMMNKIAVTAANEFTQTSVNEVNSLIAENENLQNDFYAFADSMCGTATGKDRIHGIVIKSENKEYQLYIRPEVLPYFTESKYSKLNKTCRIIRGSKVITRGTLLYSSGNYSLVLDNDTELMLGDKIQLDPLK